MRLSRLVRRASLPVLLILTPAVPGAAGVPPADGRPLRLEVSAREDVSDRQVDALRSAFLVALSTSRCGVRTMRADESPELVARVRIVRWRESQRPGGRNIFDPRTGTTRRGVHREVEVRYTVEVTDPAGEQLLKEKGNHVDSAETRTNWLWDPRQQAVLAARRGAATQVERWICRAAERLERRERKARRRARRRR